VLQEQRAKLLVDVEALKLGEPLPADAEETEVVVEASEVAEATAVEGRQEDAQDAQSAEGES